MGIEKIDITGVHRTHAVFLIAAKTVSLKPGDIMEVTGTSPPSCHENFTLPSYSCN